MDLLSVLYSMSGLIIGAAFLPQIAVLLKDSTGAASTSIWSWLIFTSVSTISLAYGLCKLHDALFIFCSSIALIGNGTVLTLSIYRRQHIAPSGLAIRPTNNSQERIAMERRRTEREPSLP